MSERTRERESWDVVFCVWCIFSSKYWCVCLEAKESLYWSWVDEFHHRLWFNELRLNWFDWRAVGNIARIYILIAYIFELNGWINIRRPIWKSGRENQFQEWCLLCCSKGYVVHNFGGIRLSYIYDHFSDYEREKR